jgi:hypothetical protein
LADRQFTSGQASQVVDLEVSFNEPMHAVEVIRLGVNGPSFAAYVLTDLIAEKFRSPAATSWAQPLPAAGCLRHRAPCDAFST